MKTSLYISALALFGVAALSSCSDFLEPENRSAGTTADSYYSTERGQNELLISAYNALKAVATTTDIYEWGTDLYIETRSKTVDELQTYKFSPENKTVTTFYTNAYNLVNRANEAIKYGSSLPKNVDEATFLRDYGYYLLTQHFGAVPYVKDYLDTPSRNYPRTPLNEIYEDCITDLTTVYNNGNIAETSHVGYASKQAVAALLAKFNLAAGWDLGMQVSDAAKGTYTVKDQAAADKYFKAAYEWAEKAINSVTLTMSFEDKWSPKNEGNAEEIFSIQYDRAGYPGSKDTNGHGLQNDYGCYYGQPSATGYKYSTSVKAPSLKALYLWAKGDTRWDGTFMTTMPNAIKNGTSVDWSTGYYAYYNSSDKNSLPIGLRYFPYYVTQSEADAELAANKNRYVKGECVNTPSAFILANVCYTFGFGSDGARSSASVSSYEDLIQLVNGTVTVKKFDDPETILADGSTVNDYRDIVLFHVSDMYLVAAEAYLMAGKTDEALAKVNAVRTRSGANALTQFSDYTTDYAVATFGSYTALDVILEERARELFAESHRWMDLRRTLQLVRYNIAFNRNISSVGDMSNSAGEIKWLRPIPANEISSNDGISTSDQNPGY